MRWAAQGSPASLPAPPPVLLCTLGSSLKTASLSPGPLPILGCDGEGLLGDRERGQALGKFAETPQGTPIAAGLTCSVLSECLAILVPNKESFSAGQEAELIEVED